MDKRFSTIDRIKARTMSSEEFDYDKLSAPPLAMLIPPNIQANISYTVVHNKSSDPAKIEEDVDKILNPMGWYRIGGGTNRTCYGNDYNSDIVLKVALTKLLFTDNPREFKNQFIFKPFVTKCFETSPDGCLGLYERVVPITSREEFSSVASEVKYVMDNWFIGKYIFTDVGTHYFMNWGVRKGFGPVLLDYPYAYELDENKMICDRPQRNSNGKIIGICGGLIDYDAGYNYLYCTKCGRKFRARELGKPEKLLEEMLYGKKNNDIYTAGPAKAYAYASRNGKVVKTSSPDLIIGTEVDEINKFVKIKPKENKTMKNNTNEEEVFDPDFGFPHFKGYKISHPSTHKDDNGVISDDYGNEYGSNGKIIKMVIDPIEGYFQKNPQDRPKTGKYSTPIKNVEAKPIISKSSEVDKKIVKEDSKIVDKIEEHKVTDHHYNNGNPVQSTMPLSSYNMNLDGKIDVIAQKIDQLTDVFIELHEDEKAAKKKEKDNNTDLSELVKSIASMIEQFKSFESSMSEFGEKIDNLLSSCHVEEVDDDGSDETEPKEEKEKLADGEPGMKAGVFFEDDINPVDRIKELEARNDDLEGKIKDLSKQIEESSKKEVKVEESKEYKELHKELDKALSDLNTSEDKAVKAESDVKELSAYKASINKKYDDLEKQVESKNNLIKELSDKVNNPEVADTSDKDEEIEELKKQIEDLKDNKSTGIGSNITPTGFCEYSAKLYNKDKLYKMFKVGNPEDYEGATGSILILMDLNAGNGSDAAIKDQDGNIICISSIKTTMKDGATGKTNVKDIPVGSIKFAFNKQVSSIAAKATKKK